MNKFICSSIHKFMCLLWMWWKCFVRSCPVHINNLCSYKWMRLTLLFHPGPCACPQSPCSSCFPREHISTICLQKALDASKSALALHLLTPAHITHYKKRKDKKRKKSTFSWHVNKDICCILILSTNNLTGKQ